MKNRLVHAKIWLLGRILNILDQISGRIRLEIGLEQPPRRPPVVTESRMLYRARVPVSRSIPRRNPLQEIEFVSLDEID